MKKLLITIFVLLSISTARADHENYLNMFGFQQVPALCAIPSVVKKYLDHYGFEPYDIALGREGMEPDGMPVYMMTYWVTKDGTQAIATIDVPQQTETCMLFHTFDRTKPTND